MSKNSSSENWRDIINRCRASGLPVKKWCTENNIPVSSYKYWNTRLKKSEGKDVEWAEVSMPVTEETPVTVHLPKQTSFTICLKDFSIKVEKDFDKGALAELLGVLRSVC